MSTEVLLMAYGGPERLDDVADYLLDVRGGRPTPPSLVAEITQRYRAIGGASPILRWTRAQAEGLERHLGLRVRTGMRHWHPYIEQAVGEAVAAGASRIVAIPMTPFFSRLSVAAYGEKLRAALPTGLEVSLAHSWHVFPPFIDAVVDRVREARAGYDDARVIFTAHSLPERLRREGDPYAAQLHAASYAVARACDLEDFTFAYQSPGKMPEPWMGPFIEDTMKQEAARGVRRFLLVPIGFVCDHVEILYDIDVVLRDLAASMEVEMRRSGSLNASTPFIEALAALVRQTLTGTPNGFVIEHLP